MRVDPARTLPAQGTALPESMMLKARKVSKVYDTKLVFKDVDLSLGPGEICIVIGPNGAGKSTLLKILCGLMAPTRGRVVCEVPRDKVGYIGHSTFIYPQLTAVDNLRFWSGMYATGHSSHQLLGLLQRVGLAGVAYELAGTFSRGMAQRLSLARVLLLDPQLIFLDEPSTGLDPASQELLRKEIAAAKHRGSAMVWVSHHVAQDLPGADSVLVLDRQRMAYFGPAGSYAQAGGAEGADVV